MRAGKLISLTVASLLSTAAAQGTPTVPKSLTPEQYQTLQRQQAINVASRLEKGPAAVLAALKNVRKGPVNLMGGAESQPLIGALREITSRGVVLNTLLAPEAPGELLLLSNGRRVNLRTNTGVTVIATPTMLIIVGRGHQDVYYSVGMAATVNDSFNRALTPPAR